MSKKRRYYCFVCSQQKNESHFSEVVLTCVGTVHRDGLRSFTNDEVAEFREDVLLFYDKSVFFMSLPCMTYAQFKKSSNKRPYCTTGNRQCNNCFTFYALISYFSSSSDSPISTSGNVLDIALEKVSPENISKAKYMFTPIVKRTRQFIRTPVSQLNLQGEKSQKWNERKKVKSQFEEIVEMMKGLLTFMVGVFKNFPMKVVVCTEFDIEVSSNGALCCELTVSDDGVVEVQDHELDIVQELDISICCDLWSLLSTVQFIAVRELLRPVLKIPNMKKFYESKRKFDQSILRNRIVQAVKVDNVTGLIISPRLLLRSLVYCDKKLLECIRVCDTKIDACRQMNSQLFFKFGSARTLVHRKLPKPVELEGDEFGKLSGENFEHVLYVNLPVGEGPDETPVTKDLKKNTHAAMINNLSLVDSLKPQSQENAFVTYLLNYPGKLEHETWLKLFGNAWNKELQTTEGLLFMRSISPVFARRLCCLLDCDDSAAVLLIVRFHFHFMGDECQFQMNQCEEKSSTRVVKSRIVLDCSKRDRLKSAYDHKGESLTKLTKPRPVVDMLAIVKALEFVKGNVKNFPGRFSKAVFSNNHIYRGFNSRRLHIDGGVHCPKRIGSLVLDVNLTVMQKVLFPSIKDLGRRNEWRKKFLHSLVVTGIVDKSVVFSSTQKELVYSKLIQKKNSVLNITGDKTKLLIGETLVRAYSGAQFLKCSFSEHLREFVEHVAASGCAGESACVIALSWVSQFASYCEVERDVNSFFTRGFDRTLKRVSELCWNLARQEIVHQTMGLLVKSFKRYCVYRADPICILYDVLENSDLASFSCSSKEQCMTVFRQLFERSPKFREFAMKKEVKFGVWNSDEVLENDPVLNTQLCIVTHWLLKNKVMKNLFLQYDSLSSEVAMIDIRELPLEIKSVLGSVLVPNVDELVPEIPLVNNSAGELLYPIPMYLLSLQNNLTELLKNTRVHIKEVKSKLNKLELTWESFEPLLKLPGVSLRQHQIDILKRWLRFIQKYEERGESPLEDERGEKLLSLLLFWFMGKGKTWVIVLLCIAWLNHMRNKFKRERPRPVVIVCVPKPIVKQFISDIEDVVTNFELNSVGFFAVSSVKSENRLKFILNTLSAKGGFLVGHPEKILALYNLACNAQNVVFDDTDGLREDVSTDVRHLLINVVFKNQNNFVVLDEAHHLLSKFSEELSVAFSSTRRKMVSTGTPIVKFGAVFHEILKWAFKDVYTKSPAKLAVEQVIAFLKNVGAESDGLQAVDEDGDEVMIERDATDESDLSVMSEVCKLIEKMLTMPPLGPYVSLNLSDQSRTVLNFVMFKPQSDAVFDGIDGGFLKRRIEVIFKSLCNDLTESKTIGRAKMNRILDGKMGARGVNTIRKVRDIDKLKSGPVLFMWKLMKKMKSLNKKLVLMCEFLKVIRFFSCVAEQTKLLDASSLKEFSGSLTSKQKHEMVNKFKKELNFALFFMTIGSGGLGLNGLQYKCNDVAVFWTPWNWSKLSQALKRVDRPPKINPQVWARVLMMCDPSKDVHLDCLRKVIIKKNFVDSMFCGKILNFWFSIEDLAEAIERRNKLYRVHTIEDTFIKRYIEKVNRGATRHRDSWKKITHVFEFHEVVAYINNLDKPGQ